MSFTWATKDKVERCVLCDAPVGVPTKLPINGRLVNGFTAVYYFAGDPYCEFCGNCTCPFCGRDNSDLTGSCQGRDVFNYPMHFEVELTEN